MTRLGWRSHFRSFGLPVALTLLTQLMSAASIVAFSSLAPPSEADAYAVGLQTGVAGLSGFAIGVVYNIAVGRTGFSRWGLAASSSALASPILGLLTFLLFELSRSSAEADRDQLVAILLAFTVGGSGLAVAGVYAVELACLGRPIALSTSTLAPSVALLLSMGGVVLLDPERGFGPLPALVWAAAAWCQAAFLAYRRRARPRSGIATVTTATGQGMSHASFLLVGVVASTVLPAIYSVAMLQLAAGTLALVFLVGRIGTALVGVGVNTLLAVLYSWRSKPRSPISLTRYLTLSAAVFGATAIGVRLTGLDLAGLVFVALSWFVLLIAAAVALRDLNANVRVRAIGGKVMVDLVLSSVLAIVLFASPSLSGYFGVYAVSQAITLGAAAVAYRDRVTIFGAACVCGSSIYFVLMGWS